MNLEKIGCDNDTGSGSCLMAGFGVGDVEPFGLCYHSYTKWEWNSWLEEITAWSGQLPSRIPFV